MGWWRVKNRHDIHSGSRFWLKVIEIITGRTLTRAFFCRAVRISVQEGRGRRTKFDLKFKINDAKSYVNAVNDYSRGGMLMFELLSSICVEVWYNSQSLTSFGICVHWARFSNNISFTSRVAQGEIAALYRCWEETVPESVFFWTVLNYVLSSSPLNARGVKRKWQVHTMGTINTRPHYSPADPTWRTRWGNKQCFPWVQPLAPSCENYLLDTVHHHAGMPSTYLHHTSTSLPASQPFPPPHHIDTEKRKNVTGSTK